MYIGEMQGRYRGDIGEMQARCRRDVGEIKARYRCEQGGGAREEGLCIYEDVYRSIG
jgi:hypothetical protein